MGATLTFVFRQDQAPEFTGTVVELELDEPRLLAYTWGEETLRFVLTPRPDGATHLVLTDELDSGIAARNAAGWETCLVHLAGESPDDESKPLFDQYAAAFEPALGPQEGPPPGFDAKDCNPPEPILSDGGRGWQRCRRMGSESTVRRASDPSS